MGVTRFQVFKMAAPLKNNETGEICENLVSVKYNPKVNDESGEHEEIHQKSLFKVPKQIMLPVKEKHKSAERRCEKCQWSRHSFTLIIFTMMIFLPSLGVLLYLTAESLLHQYVHKYHSSKKSSFRNRLHSLLYSEFCAFCQSERSMDLIGKLQEERMEKMRKYVKSIPIP